MSTLLCPHPIICSLLRAERVLACRWSSMLLLQPRMLLCISLTTPSLAPRMKWNCRQRSMKSAARCLQRTSRFRFVLNKVDTKKAADDIEDIRKTVALKISSLHEGVAVSPQQILPVSAQHADLLLRSLKRAPERSTKGRQASCCRWTSPSSAA